jgi:outer membrane protein OmpA-like peptidoglycan-associated protein
VQRASEQVRERLRRQLNSVLETTETARGLIVNMSDVLFDFNKYTLKPEAREKLAKVSGILLAYPNLKVQVEGYTDNIGSDEYNQRLSEQRADRVREYLVSESVRDANVTAKGYGKSDAVADNATNNGRAKNRRVELVVSGGAIGIEQSAPAPEGINEPAPPAEQPSPQRSAAESNMTGSSNPPH